MSRRGYKNAMYERFNSPAAKRDAIAQYPAVAITPPAETHAKKVRLGWCTEEGREISWPERLISFR